MGNMNGPSGISALEVREQLAHAGPGARGDREHVIAGVELGCLLEHAEQRRLGPAGRPC